MVKAIKKKVHLSYQRLRSNVARFYLNSDYRKGNRVELSDGRIYEVQRDGSWRVLNKPRSRVKRLRATRTKG
jgi:hypothetical protein